MTEIAAYAMNCENIELRLRQRERQLTAVSSVTQALQAHRELDELVQHAVLTVLATLEAEAGSLLLHDANRHTLKFRYVEGPTKERVIGMEIADSQGIAGEVFQTGKSRISLDVNADRAHILDIDRAAEYTTRSMITVPLATYTGEIIGVLQVLNKRDGIFTDEDLTVLQVIAAQVASAIITAQLHERAQSATIVDLLGQISHDIKNLLTPVSMAGQTLRFMLDDFTTAMTTRLQQQAEGSCATVDELTGMVQHINEDVSEIFSILDESTQIAQMRAKEIADSVRGLTAPPIYELADINEIVTGVSRVLRIVAEQRGVTLQVEPGDCLPCLLDNKRMYNALYNLVHNAIGATESGGTVTVRTLVRLEGLFPDGHYVEVSVTDTGYGMPPETAAILFSGKVRSTKPGGTGLGARVVQNVIAAHNGRLIVDSIQGKGTTIAARIPIRKNA